MISKELAEAIEDPCRFHYKDLWLQERNLEQRNLLELFAFGSLDDMNARIATQLTQDMIMKLRKQTMISLSEHYQEIHYDLIRQKCQVDSSHDIETMLIQLRDVFLVELDSVRQVVTITEHYDCRDVYSHERELNVVQAANVTTKDKIREDLLAWKRKLLKDILDA